MTDRLSILVHDVHAVLARQGRSCQIVTAIDEVVAVSTVSS